MEQTRQDRLELYDGTYWEQLRNGDVTFPHYYLYRENGVLSIYSNFGYRVPPSVALELAGQLIAYADGTDDLTILQENIATNLEDERRHEERAKATKEQRRVKTAGFLYAVRCNDKIKLGRTKNLESRFTSYRRAAEKFEVIKTCPHPDYVKGEIELIAAFGGVAGKSEWFDYTPERELEVIKYFAEELLA